MKAADHRLAGTGASLALHCAGLACLVVLYRPSVPARQYVQPQHEAIVLVSPPPELKKSISLTPAPALASPSAKSIEEPSAPSPVLGRFDAAGASEPVPSDGGAGRIRTGMLPGPPGSPIGPSGEPGSIVVGNLGAGGMPLDSGEPSSGTVRLSSGFGSGTGIEGGVPTGLVSASPRLLSAPFAAYTQEARRLGIRGVVVLKVKLTASGTVHVLEILQALGHGLDETAKEAAMAMRFLPAHNSSGLPVDAIATVTVLFDMT
jgi:periplasmic protein TonB